MNELKIEVEQINEKERPYADHQVKYIIKAFGGNKIVSENFILNLCTKVLTNCNKKYDDADREIYEPYYNLVLVDENKEQNMVIYNFTITTPYLD